MPLSELCQILNIQNPTTQPTCIAKSKRGNTCNSLIDVHYRNLATCGLHSLSHILQQEHLSMSHLEALELVAAMLYCSGARNGHQEQAEDTAVDWFAALEDACDKDGRVRLNKASYERNRQSSGNAWSAINRTLPVLLVPTTSHRHGQRWNSFVRHVPESQPSSTKEVPSPEETQNVPDYDSADEGDISDWSASMDDSQQLDGFYGISTPPTPIFRHDFCREIINPPPPPEPHDPRLLLILLPTALRNVSSTNTASPKQRRATFP